MLQCITHTPHMFSKMQYTRRNAPKRPITRIPSFPLDIRPGIWERPIYLSYYPTNRMRQTSLEPSKRETEDRVRKDRYPCGTGRTQQEKRVRPPPVYRGQKKRNDIRPDEKTPGDVKMPVHETGGPAERMASDGGINRCRVDVVRPWNGIKRPAFCIFSKMDQTDDRFNH